MLMWIFNSKSMFAQRIFFFFLFLERFDMWSNKKKKKGILKIILRNSFLHFRVEQVYNKYI